MKLSRFLFSGLISAFLVGILLIGCSSGNDKQDKDSSGEGSKEPITLNLWGGLPPESGPQQMVDNWNKDNPDVRLEYTRYVNDADGKLKLDTALNATDQVDIYFSYDLPALKKRVNAGNAVDLGTLDGY